jgi:hypothetical protein
MAVEFVDYIPMNLNDPGLTPHDGKSQRVEPGTYIFEVEKAVFDQSKKGNKVLRVTLKIADEGAMQGRQMMGSYVISDEEFARRRMLALVRATRADVDQTGGFSAASLIGLRLRADVVAHSWEDIDAKTGLPAQREGTRYEGERPEFDDDEGQVHTQVAAATPAKTAGTPPSNAPRRPNAPATNGARGRA